MRIEMHLERDILRIQERLVNYVNVYITERTEEENDKT